jgi:hypothetical protein
MEVPNKPIEGVRVCIPCRGQMTDQEQEDFKRKWLEQYRGPKPVEFIFQEASFPKHPWEQK